MSDSGKAVFLSYASQDAEAAKKICAALRAAGIEVWFDQSELVGGDAWDQMIRRQIKECALFVPLISASTQRRLEGYFRLEWRLADQRTHLMARGKAFLLPVVIDGTANAGAQVPDSFLEVQWTLLQLQPNSGQGHQRGRANDAITVFAKRVKALLERSEPERQGRVPASDAPARSVAVLPFVNLSGDQANEYFSDGISEELLNVLARIPGLRVSARTSSFYFRGRNVPVPEIGRQLGVAYLVEGSVRKSGNRVRVTVQFIHAAEGYRVWSGNYDREVRDIFALQDEIAADVASHLRLEFGAGPERGPVDPEVHRLVLQGRHFWNQFNEDGFVRAEAAFAKALEIAPGSAMASAGFALVWCRRAIMATVASRHIAGMLDHAERHARQAQDTDPDLPEPHAVLGMVALMRGNLAESDRAFQRTLSHNPNFDIAWVYHARLLARQGRPDLAVPELEEAHLLSPAVGAFAGHRGAALLGCRRYADALEVVERAESIESASPWTRATAALALSRLERHAEAVTRAQAALEPGPKQDWPPAFNTWTDGLAAWALAEAGAPDEAEVVVQRLCQEPEERRFSAGFALALLGPREEAFTLLADIPQWLVDYLLFFGQQNKMVRTDPGFLHLLERLDAVDAFAMLERTVGTSA